MNKTATHHLDINKLFENILNKSIKIAGAQCGYLFIYNKNKNEFALKAYSELINKNIYYENFLNDIINKVLNKKHSIILSQNEIEKEYFKYKNTSIYGFRSIMAIPIKKTKKIIGVCYMENPFLKDNFTEKDAKSVSVFMDQTAIAIENANIYHNLKNEVDEKTKELQLSNEMLLKINHFKNEYIENITHDFKSPLTIILNIIHNIINVEKELSCRTVDSLYMIHNASLQLKKSVDKLLTLSKLESERIDIKIKKVNPKKLLKKIITLYSSSELIKNIKIIKEIPEDDILDFYTDIDMFESIINNIMSNAVKFVSQNTGRITVRLINNPDKIKICIKDNGIGITKNELEVIFTRYNHTNIDQKKHDSTGIGLSYAKQLIKYLNGNIYAESEGKNRGANFVIEFPKYIKMKSCIKYNNQLSENKYS